MNGGKQEGACPRRAEVARRTNETDVRVAVVLDGSGTANIKTGVAFFDHMLELFARHGLFDVTVEATGDVHVDDHHTVEDVGICLGRAFREALGDKRGIRRYGHALVPMDESLVEVAVDIGDRPHFEYRVRTPSERIGTMSVESVREFWWKFALEARVALHVVARYGRNSHHLVEAVFKAAARALDEATAVDPRVQGVPSTKGVL
ncbi:MAG: imidazoleglycerol-phosphate dehydratase [Candidatus Reconcilbacillus cellulovorans]|uniref:Imidazoleglycerol-phosphate dehydratase n=1 Tax=Candidatus Reconcilbacillus cellulovorans TaxID=1906605 RepID=A0A2A6E2U5_9BACL|nr:MAG: imidazoleglycerol-phosphate dehydratase [Candidatus Reconcilbacillus cellulovorans]